MKTWLTLPAVLTGLAVAQQASSQQAPGPSFSAAQIESSAKVTNPGMRGPIVRGERYQVKDATMLDLIVSAYGFDRDHVQGGPTWLDSDRFDIIARSPAGVAQAAANQMLQALLEDRFGLAVHKDTRPLPAYALTTGKGQPKLKEATSEKAAPGCNNTQTGDNEDAVTEVACHNETMQAFTDYLRLMEVPGGLQNQLVIDSTNLQGAWDFDFKWTPRRLIALGATQPITLSEALEKQLGLKLESRNAPIAVLVVDRVNRNPTANAPDIASKLPPAPPAEFEVAEIRPSTPDEQTDANFENGRLDARAIPLKELIKAAFNINSDGLVAGLPKFADSAKFDIVAKASIDPKLASQIDDDTLLLMVRGLLVDRFKLKTHMEDRQVQANVLTAVKPKLTKADPSSRTECKEGPGRDGKDPRVANPQLNRLLSCYNMTMAQFADMLPNRISGYVQTQVRDETGLTEAYDFTLSFSGVNIVNNLNRKRGPDGASEPSAALSLQEAISKQMGLKLELQKRTAQVLVVDHVEEKPTDN